jgi:hypothetical protein
MCVNFGPICTNYLAYYPETTIDMKRQIQKLNWKVLGHPVNTSTFLPFIFFLLSLTAMGGLHAQETAQQAQDVEIRVFLFDVEKVDTAAQSFTANLTLMM